MTREDRLDPGVARRMMAPVQRDLPNSTVTFLFTDVEGSTKLLQELGADAYAEALADHRRLVREACARHEGVEVDTQGDAFFFAFPTAPGAVAAAGNCSSRPRPLSSSSSTSSTSASTA